MRRTVIYMICLALALSWAACKPMEDELQPVDSGLLVSPADSVWALTVRAVKEAPATKGVEIGDGQSEANTTKLLSVWKGSERVYVYQGVTPVGYLTATPDDTDPHYATLSGSITTTSITPGSTLLTLLTPVSSDDWTYTGQVGRLLSGANDDGKSIDSRYSIAKAENVLVTDVNGNSITTSQASFVSQQSIYRLSFRFQNGGTGDKTNICAKRLTITSENCGLWRNAAEGTGPIDVTLESATSDPFFVALRNLDSVNEEALHFQVLDSDGITYFGSKVIPAQYKRDGTFVSLKNATLTSRLGVKMSKETVEHIL